MVSYLLTIYQRLKVGLGACFAENATILSTTQSSRRSASSKVLHRLVVSHSDRAPLPMLTTRIDPRKRKPSAAFAQGEEDKFVLPNSNSLSCLAGAPRGIFNLGQTCYLSVILQAMVHNPLMRNFFLSGRHETVDCPIENCIACALVASFADVLATEKIDGHGPLELLYRYWQNKPVRRSAPIFQVVSVLMFCTEARGLSSTRRW